jgi:hypothetical protein
VRNGSRELLLRDERCGTGSHAKGMPGTKQLRFAYHPPENAAVMPDSTRRLAVEPVCIGPFPTLADSETCHLRN